jgi:threonyl-tRNA synthetase
MAKIPYMAVVGKREMENGSVSGRSRKQGDLGALSKKDFIALLSREVADKK